MTPKDAALAVLVMALWGVNFVASKVALHAFSPMFLMTLRFALVCVLLLPFARFPAKQWRGVAVLSTLLGGMHFPLIFMGMQGVDAAVGAIVAQLQVPFSSLIAAVLFKDYLGWKRALGMGLAFGGIVVIAGEPHGDSSLVHILYIVASGVAFAVANVQIKRIGPIDGFSLTAWMTFFALPQVALLSLIFESGQVAALAAAPLKSWLALAYIAGGSSILGYGIWYRLARTYDVNQTMPYLLLIPLFGVLSGVLMLGESVTFGLLVGGAMTVGGVAVIMIRRPKAAESGAGSVT
jgi:O-acetylserine/cysteine efflux transporter